MIRSITEDAGIPAITSHAEGVTTKPAKKRVSKACDRCRRRKIKCDDLDPVSGKCSNCIKYKVPCTFHYHEEMIRRTNSKAKSRITKFSSDTTKSELHSITNNDNNDNTNSNNNQNNSTNANGSVDTDNNNSSQIDTKNDTNSENNNHNNKSTPSTSNASNAYNPGIIVNPISLKQKANSNGIQRNTMIENLSTVPMTNNNLSEAVLPNNLLSNSNDQTSTSSPSLEQNSVFVHYPNSVPVNSIYQTPLPFNNTPTNGYTSQPGHIDMIPVSIVQNSVLLPQHNQYQPQPLSQHQHPVVPPPVNHSLNQPLQQLPRQRNQQRDNTEHDRQNQQQKATTNATQNITNPQKHRDHHNDPVGNSSLEGMVTQGQLSVLDNKIDILGRKMTLLMDYCTRLDWIGRQCELFINKSEQSLKTEEAKGRNSEVHATPKRYNSCQYTESTLLWLRTKVCPEISKDEYLRPLVPVKAMVSRWYFIQMKRLVKNISDESQLLPIPDSIRCQRIMETYYSLLSAEDLNVIEPKACQKIFEKYFSSKAEEISYSEHLIVNILLSLGSLCARHSLMESNHYRKDKLDFTPEKLFQIENDCYQNSLFYYHKISLVCEGLLSVQALLLLYSYIRSCVSTEAALNIFVVAVKFARDLELCYLDNFNHLPREDFLQIRSIWLYCYLNDSNLSMTLGKPPIIDESDMSVSFGRNYFKTLKAECPISRSPDANVVDAMKDESMVVGWVKINPWYFPVILNYFRACLCKISNKITRYLFSVDVTSVMTFDEIVAKINEIKDDLITYSNNIPLYLRLDNQRTFLARIYHELAESQKIANFKLMSVLMTEINIKRETLFIILANFTRAFFDDNWDIVGGGLRPDCEELSKYFEVNKLHSFKATLKASKAIDFKDYTILLHKQHVFFDLLLVVLSASFYVINNVDSSAAFELLCMLKDLYYRVTNGTSITELHLQQNIKWLVSIFLLSFQLEMGTMHYKNKNALACTYPLDSDRYQLVMKEISVTIGKETEKITAVFNKERSSLSKESSISSNAGKMPTWALLKPFGLADDSTEEMLRSWWDKESQKQVTKQEDTAKMPKGILENAKNSDGKNNLTNSRNYDLGFNFNERWFPPDMRFLSQESFMNSSGRNNSDASYVHPTTLFEDISSLNR